MAAENKFKVIWTDTGMEIVGVLRGSSDPLGQLLVVCYACTCRDDSDFMIGVYFSYAPHSTDNDLQG